MKKRLLALIFSVLAIVAVPAPAQAAYLWHGNPTANCMPSDISGTIPSTFVYVDHGYQTIGINGTIRPCGWQQNNVVFGYLIWTGNRAWDGVLIHYTWGSATADASVGLRLPYNNWQTVTQICLVSSPASTPLSCMLVAPVAGAPKITQVTLTDPRLVGGQYMGVTLPDRGVGFGPLPNCASCMSP